MKTVVMFVENKQVVDALNVNDKKLYGVLSRHTGDKAIIMRDGRAFKVYPVNGLTTRWSGWFCSRETLFDIVWFLLCNDHKVFEFDDSRDFGKWLAE